jgi:hypothetical protein
MAPQYCYSPLSQKPNAIRLLRILSSKHEPETLRCELFEYDLQGSETANYPYEALSYVWGCKNQTQSIIIDDQELAVTHNLYKALLRLRDHEIPRIIWADAVCINQDDVNERTQQVGHMGRIYSEAKRVLIWLGDDENCYAKIAFDFIRQRLYDGTAFTELLLERPEDMADYDEKKMSAVYELVRGQWFTRTWILQEVGLSREAVLVWGEEEIDWRIFATLVQVLSSCAVLPEQLSAILKVSLTITLFQEEPKTFIDLLDAGREFLATDPRDKVFAFLSHPLARVKSQLSSDITTESSGNGSTSNANPPNDEVIIQPNYNKGFAEVYHELAENHIRKSFTLEVLSAVRHFVGDGYEEHNLPSWVPRWDQGPRNSIYGLQNRRYLAGGKVVILHPDIFLSDGRQMSRKLQLRGFQFAVVRSHSGQLKDGFDFLPILKPAFINSFSSRLSTFSNSVYGKGEEHLLAYVETLTSFNYWDSENNKDELKANFNEWWKTVTEPLLGSEYLSWFEDEVQRRFDVPFEVGEKQGQWNIFNMALGCSTAVERRFFQLSNGFIGLGPEMIQENDVCGIFYGAKVPFILRESEEGYQLIGECYVHGIMHGEVCKPWHEIGLDNLPCVTLV